MSKRSSIFIFVLLGYLVTVVLIYHFESATDSSNIKTLFDAFWYSLVTLTTVGYGDFYPMTRAGKILSVTMLFASLGILGYFVGKLTEHIQELTERHKMGMDGTNFINHVIIVGWNDFSEGVVTQLVNAGKKTCVITDNKAHIDIIHSQFKTSQVFAIFSDYSCREYLSKANAAKAASLMPCLGDDTKNLVYILNAKKEYPSLSFVVTLDNAELKDTFISAGVSFTISRNEISSKIVASYIFEPCVAKFSEDLLASASKNNDFDIQQYYIKKSCKFANSKFSEVFDELKQSLNVLCIGISRNTEQGYELIKLPESSTMLNVGDYIVVMTSGRSANQLSEIFGCSEGLYFES